MIVESNLGWFVAFGIFLIWQAPPYYKLLKNYDNKRKVCE